MKIILEFEDEEVILFISPSGQITAIQADGEYLDMDEVRKTARMVVESN